MGFRMKWIKSSNRYYYYKLSRNGRYIQMAQKDFDEVKIIDQYKIFLADVPLYQYKNPIGFSTPQYVRNIRNGIR